MEFEVILKTENIHKYVLKSNQKTLKIFPFKFELYVTYEIEEDVVITKYNVINKDEHKMIFGIGGHPAYICQYSTEKYKIEFGRKEDKIEFYKLKNGLLVDKKIDNILIDNSIILTKDIFNEDAIIMKNIKSNIVTLKEIDTQKTILEFNFEGFPYLAIWSKIGAPFICIEPWQNHADSINSNGNFEEKENILKLDSNKEFSCSYSVKIFN